MTFEAITDDGVFQLDPTHGRYVKVRENEMVRARHTEHGQVYQVVIPPDSGGRFSLARIFGLPTDSDTLPTFFAGSPLPRRVLPGGFGYAEAGVEFPLAGLEPSDEASLASRRTEFVLSVPSSSDGKPILFDFRSPIHDPSGDGDRPLGFQSDGDITIVEVVDGDNRELVINGESVPLEESGADSLHFNSVFIETDRSGPHHVSVTSSASLSDGQVRTKEFQHDYLQKRLVFDRAFPVLELPPGTPFTIENSFRWDAGDADVTQDDPQWTVTVASLDGTIVAHETGTTPSISVEAQPPRSRGEPRPVEVVVANSPRHQQILAQESAEEDKEIWVVEATASARTFPAESAAHWRGGTTPRTGEEGRYHIFAGGEADPGQQRVEVGTIVLDPPLDQVFVDPEPIPEGEEPEVVTAISAGVAVIGLLNPDAHYWLEILHEPTGDQVFRFPSEDGRLESLEEVIGTGASDSVHFYGIEVFWDGRDRVDPSRIIVEDPFLIKIHVTACGQPVTDEVNSRLLAQVEEPVTVCLDGAGTRRYGSTTLELLQNGEVVGSVLPSFLFRVGQTARVLDHPGGEPGGQAGELLSRGVPSEVEVRFVLGKRPSGASLPLELTLEVTPRGYFGHDHRNDGPTGVLRAAALPTTLNDATLRSLEAQLYDNLDRSLEKTIMVDQLNHPVSLYYLAPLISGAYNFRVIHGATTLASQTLTVSVPGLSPLEASLAQEDLQQMELVGETETHQSNHFGMLYFNQSLAQVARDFFKNTGEKLYINDQSLIRGGKFDVFADWSKREAHYEHRLGENADVNTDSILASARDINLEKVCRQNDIAVYREVHPPHYHLRPLLGPGTEVTP